MADLIVNVGLQVIGGRASNTADAFNEIDGMSVDDSTVAFAATDLALDTGGAITNEADADFDSTPTRSGQTISHVSTFGTGVANFTIRRIALHNQNAANISSGSATLVAGVDGQSIVKSSDFSLTITLKISYTSA